MGNDLPYGEGPQWFPPPGGTVDGRHGAQKSTGCDMGVTTHWRFSGNGGDGLDQGVYHPLPE